MNEFKLIRNEAGYISAIETSLTGHALLSAPKLNKGCAFTQEERERFGLLGLLPARIETITEQAERLYAQYSEHTSNLAKHIHLNVLHDYNETLFYYVVSRHLEEMLPIIYTPTVGEAVQRFSVELRKPKGLYIAYSDRDRLDEILDNRLLADIDLAVITDGEAVLGIGDQGIGGINISSAKLMVYTLCAGINPHRVLPVQLDVGTNNPHLLNDPMYLGWRHERIGKQEYDEFVEQFVKALQKRFPSIYLHWEDMGRDNARRILSRYRQEACTINGDIQATGVVALASVLAGVVASGVPLRDHRVVVFGAGAAGIGIADQIVDAMVRAGLSEQEALSRFYLIDRQGLLTDGRNNLLPFQKRYVTSRDELSHWSCDILQSKQVLLDVVENAKPSILIGCSTVAGAFNEAVVKAMAAGVSRPIILPLSNPTSLSEALPSDLLEWTNGNALIATGSPFADVEFNGKRYRIAQSNNALAFPGIGLGVIMSKAKRLTDDMLWAATEALSRCSPVYQDKTASLLPKLAETHMVSRQVAIAVAKAAVRDGVAGIHLDDSTDWEKLIRETVWEPEYYPYQLSRG